MERGIIHIFTGDGRGKTSAAIGKAVQAAAEGQSVVLIQFLKDKGLQETDFVKKLEPEIKLFRFEKSDEGFEELPEERKAEEIMNIKNGMNFAKKVLGTGEADVLVLDEVLGLVAKEIISVEELKNVIQCKSEDTTLILTGIALHDDICVLADEVSRIETLKFKVWE
jgi:cob(I)alamin adenosyltransferase